MKMSNPSLFQLIAHIESHADQYAIRFEPRVYEKKLYFSDEVSDRIILCNKCSHETALVISSSSWGMTQEMGFNLYAQHGFRQKLGEFLCSVPQQKMFFEKFVDKHLIHYRVQDLYSEKNRNYFAVKYNGSVLYAKEILKALRYFGVAK